MRKSLNCRGDGYILPCVIILIIAAIFSIVFTYTSVISVVQLSRENSKVVLDSFVTTNSTVIYDSIKQGNSFTEAVNTEEFIAALCDFCTLDSEAETLYSKDREGNEKYSITGLRMTYKEENKLEVVLNYTLFVPVRFGRRIITTAHIPIEITSSLTEKC